jgi:hypothetical protein
MGRNTTRYSGQILTCGASGIALFMDATLDVSKVPAE